MPTWQENVISQSAEPPEVNASLTIAAVGTDWFDVALIPETLSRTNLSTLEVGKRVNVEVDLLARYLESLLRERD